MIEAILDIISNKEQYLKLKRYDYWVDSGRGTVLTNIHSGG